MRPTDREPPTRPGLYVFRFFDVNNADVDEIAKLSFEAWTTFETTDAYRAQPQGLFCQNDRTDVRGIMLLCTWYDGLESWQTSRSPPAEAADNFRRRHQLTFGTIAYAANLVPASFGQANRRKFVTAFIFGFTCSCSADVRLLAYGVFTSWFTDAPPGGSSCKGA